MRPFFAGLIAAPFTPFGPDGRLDLDMIPRLAALLAAQGVRGAFVCGTTGEGASMTLEERMQVAEAWRRAVPAGLAVIVHVGHNCVEDSRTLAAHAQAIGADAIAAAPPSFFRPAMSALVEVCSAIASAAPTRPFYFYHIPSMTGVDVPMADFLEQAADRIPSLAGVKFTHENLLDYGNARAVLSERFDLLFGRDEILLSGLALGARGAVGSTYNYAGRLYQDIIRAHENADSQTARELQQKSMRFITTFCRYGGVNAGKAIMKLCGFDCGPVRLPMKSLTAEALARLHEDLRAQGFFEFAASPELAEASPTPALT